MRVHLRAATADRAMAATNTANRLMKPTLVGWLAALPNAPISRAPGTSPTAVAAKYGVGRTGDRPAA